MTSLDAARQGRAAVRQLRALMRTGTINQRDLDRLLGKIEAGFEQMMGEDPIPSNLPPFHVLNGGRA